MIPSFPPPVDQLLALGEPGEIDEGWDDYRALGIGDEHVPALLDLLRDERLDWRARTDDDDEARFWARLHAWRALAQLRAEAAAAPLIEFMLRDMGDDWAHSEIPEVLGIIGPAALGPVRHALAREVRRGVDGWLAGALGDALAEIGATYPDARDSAVEALTRQLRLWPDQEADVNAFLIGNLADLGAVEAAPVMEDAFAAEAVDLTIQGDWEDVQVRMGLLPERVTPRSSYFIRWRPVARPVRPVPANAAAKARRLRKAQKASRKKNRRRR